MSGTQTQISSICVSESVCVRRRRKILKVGGGAEYIAKHVQKFYDQSTLCQTTPIFARLRLLAQEFLDEKISYKSSGMHSASIDPL